MTDRRPTRRAVLSTGAVAAVALLAAACSGGDDTVAGQAGGADRRYSSQDGAVETIPAANRDLTLDVHGTTLDGAALDSRTYRGKVVVLNTWGSWCPPCNAEATDLQSVWAARRAQGVQFLGIALREQPVTSRAFQRRFGITYPSLGWDGGSVLLQLHGQAPAPPTTLVLDRQARLAARVLGKVDRSTLDGLVEDVLREQPA